MQPVVLTALISGLCVAIPNIIATVSSNRKSSTLMNYKIDELTKTVEKHNKVIDRMYEAEKRIAIIEDEIKEIKK